MPMSTYAQRFTDALAFITEAWPPSERVAGVQRPDDLQNWVGGLSHRPEWCQNIGVLDAADAKARAPVEGEGPDTARRGERSCPVRQLRNIGLNDIGKTDMSRLEEIRRRTDKPHLALREYEEGKFRIAIANLLDLKRPLNYSQAISLSELNPQLLGAWVVPTLSQAVQAWYRPAQENNRSVAPCL